MNLNNVIFSRKHYAEPALHKVIVHTDTNCTT